MPKISRDRGAGYERELAAQLSDELGRVVQRKLGQARDGGADFAVGPFVIEAKRRRRIGSAYLWLRQAVAAAGPGQVPVVIARADGQESIVVLRLRDFVPMVRDAL